jgi:hypothetical protein
LVAEDANQRFLPTSECDAEPVEESVFADDPGLLGNSVEGKSAGIGGELPGDVGVCRGKVRSLAHNAITYRMCPGNNDSMTFNTEKII